MTLGKLLFVCLALSLVVKSPLFGQVEVASFNDKSDSQIGLGVAITGFNSNVSYYVSPYYAFHLHRHWFAFTPFYGNLGGTTGQQDVGVGFDYRIYPFKNLNQTRLYFPLGIHYIYSWSKRSEQNGMFYTAGFGTEADLGKHFLLSVDANVGLGQTLATTAHSAETGTFGSSNPLNFYFLPVIRLSYGL